MSLVTTARFTSGHKTWLSTCTSAVLPLPTGPATPARKARILLAFIFNSRSSSKQEIPLSKRQDTGRLASEQLAVGADLVCFGVHFDMRRGRIVNHVSFPDLPAIRHRNRPLAEA